MTTMARPPTLPQFRDAIRREGRAARRPPSARQTAPPVMLRRARVAIIDYHETPIAFRLRAAQKPRRSQDIASERPSFARAGEQKVTASLIFIIDTQRAMSPKPRLLQARVSAFWHTIALTWPSHSGRPCAADMMSSSTLSNTSSPRPPRYFRSPWPPKYAYHDIGQPPKRQTYMRRERFSMPPSRRECMALSFF